MSGTPPSRATVGQDDGGDVPHRAVDTAARRPIRSRQSRWAALAASWLTRRGVSPNAISVASVGFAALAGGAIALSADAEPIRRALLLLVAALGIQARLVCNLLDGMVAVEGGRSTPSGAVYNELPDRFADTAILVGAGMSITAVGWGGTLGWSAALLAVLTAYVRALGASLGAGHHFVGPMAKQQRMAVMAAACVVGALAASIDSGGILMTVALALIAAGCLLTTARRTRRIVRALEAR